MSLKTLISKTFQKFSKWEVEYEPLPKKAVVIGAPHTSYWDGIFMAVAFFDAKRDFKFLVKNSMINGPLSPLVKWVGGVGVNRSASNGMVNDIVAQAKDAEDFLLVIAPKGTRSRREYWKSGFYHIAYMAEIPVVLGYIDADNKRYGWAGSIKLTGDVSADMDKIRAFYANKVGKRPHLGCVPRLRVEDDEPQPRPEDDESAQLQ